MSEQSYLALMLDAPLMSFGFASRFQRRTTALHPTRSALLGMICAAQGLAKGTDAERNSLTRMESLRMTILEIRRQPDGSRPPLEIRRLDDFHTVSGTRSAENKIKKDAVISRRQYLLDARFGVILAGPREVLEEIAGALRNPRWGVWFGRKNCIPASPIVHGNVAASIEDAMAALDLAGHNLTEFTRIEDATSFSDGTDTLMDSPLNFATREFNPRRIRKIAATRQEG